SLCKVRERCRRGSRYPGHDERTTASAPIPSRGGTATRRYWVYHERASDRCESDSDRGWCDQPGAALIARLGAVIGRGTAKDGRLRPATNEIDASWDSSGSMADQFSRAATADDLSVPCFRASDRGKSITFGNLSLVVNCFGLFGANAAFKMQQFADEQHH